MSIGHRSLFVLKESAIGYFFWGGVIGVMGNG